MTDPHAALEKLEAAKDEFVRAMDEFRKTFEPNTVGLDELNEHLEDVLYDIYEEIENA